MTVHDLKALLSWCEETHSQAQYRRRLMAASLCYDHETREAILQLVVLLQGRDLRR